MTNKNVFASNLKRLMALRDKSRKDLSQDLNISYYTVTDWCNGKKYPRMDKVEKLAEYFGVLKSDLIEEHQPNQPRFLQPKITADYVTFPVIGEIAAGFDKIAVEDWTGETVDVPTSYLHGRKPSEFFVLTVKGDSMYPHYMENDKVLILKQTTVNRSGDVGAIMYNGECATLKKLEFVQGEDWLRLVPINPNHKPVEIEGADLEQCRVLGIPKVLLRQF